MEEQFHVVNIEYLDVRFRLIQRNAHIVKSDMHNVTATMQRYHKE